MASLDYSSQLKNLVKAQKKAQTAELQNTRNQALSSLAAEQQQNAANYATQRNTANAQNRLSARNFQEYLANTGRANSGLGAQAAMQYNNNLNTSLNSIYGAENAANADILRRRTDAQNAYNTGLAKANAEIQANYIQNLLNEKAKAFERQMAEKEFKESVRQFNKNYALQKQKSFSSGSGGGSSRNGTYYESNDIELVDSTPKSKTYSPPVATVAGMTVDAKTLKSMGGTKTKQKTKEKAKAKATGKNNPTKWKVQGLLTKK